MSNKLYFSVDMESDGPSPMKNSMLSLAAVVYDEKGTRLKETFSMNIAPISGRVQCEDTYLEFWLSHQAAWRACHENQQNPEVVMPKFLGWVEGLKKKYNADAMFVAYPACFDFTWVINYLMEFSDGCTPFGRPNGKPFYDMIDMQSLAAGILRKPYDECPKEAWPKEWFSNFPHTHIAVEDALAQGEIFASMLCLCSSD